MTFTLSFIHRRKHKKNSNGKEEFVHEESDDITMTTSYSSFGLSHNMVSPVTYNVISVGKRQEQGEYLHMSSSPEHSS